MRSTSVLVALLAGIAVAACSLPVPDPFPRSALQSALDRLVETRAASAALLRIEEGDHEWAASAGPQEPSSSVAANASGRFRIGSVTKTFVATVVLQLVDEGRLALDDPIARHLPGLVPGGDAITVRQVLDHTSGIYDYAHERDWSTNRWRGEARFRTYRPQELLDVAFATPPYFAPGQGWHYSNTNYVIAGLLVERLTGQPYGVAITDRILRPLKLNHTTVPGSDPHLPEPHVRAVVEVDGVGMVDVTEMDPSLDWAAGEMISTTSDLNRFLAALLGGELISGGALAAMRDTVDTGGQGFRYGLGLQEFDLPCGVTVVGHGGELLGYLTYAMTTDSGRQLTLSYSPLERGGSTTETVVGLFATAFCPPAQGS
ncbi:serine hydrolase domain-containing protein [Pseudonocardia sichuanensis]|uniref:D-alanyl-D-alanine carboxypeptidase n=1 Tax=Pseudonocardia kunmingensis TaxID=630975 RepID=A0A543E2M4_9PSEU|nr:serine hydrolase domain-containing protein [Pseudonocardia kunmingensis]TQM15854.1 D-alanyl-D-alanine carboxypeptidase [Pseudonocardia kunmingensis]